MLATHLQLALKLRMSGVRLLPPLYAFMAWTEKTFLLGFSSLRRSLWFQKEGVCFLFHKTQRSVVA